LKGYGVYADRSSVRSRFVDDHAPDSLDLKIRGFRFAMFLFGHDSHTFPSKESLSKVLPDSGSRL